MSRSMTWVNDDGLVVKTGVDEAASAKGGEWETDGDQRIVEFVLDWEDMPAFDAGTFSILNDGMRVPESGWRIEYVEHRVIEAWDSSGDALTLDVGLVDADDRTTEYDFDGIIEAATQAELNANTTPSRNEAAYVGGVVGVDISNDVPLLFCVDIDGATATAGRSVVRIALVANR